MIHSQPIVLCCKWGNNPLWALLMYVNNSLGKENNIPSQRTKTNATNPIFGIIV